MSKIVKLFSEHDNTKQELIEHIEQLLEFAKNDELDNLMIAAKTSDGNVMTGYCNLDVGDKQFLASHVQTDINFEVVKVNVDTLIE